MDKRFALLVLLVLLAVAVVGLWPGDGGGGRPDRVEAGAAPQAPSPTPADPSETIPEPNPTLGPNQVIKLIVDALHDNDSPEPDTGIAVAYRFSSPQSRRLIGSLDQFSEVARGPKFRPLLNHQVARYGRIYASETPQGRVVRQAVWVLDVQGRSAAYTFVVTKQKDGQYRDCWMTELVTLSPQYMPPPAPPDNPDQPQPEQREERRGILV